MTGNFRDYFNLESLASDYMKAYFNQKNLYCGGSIPTGIFHDRTFISYIFNTTIEESTKLAYAHMDQPTEEEERDAKKRGGICRDVKLLVSILNTCGEMRIPKCFHGGIILAHLELCEGVRVFERQ